MRVLPLAAIQLMLRSVEEGYPYTGTYARIHLPRLEQGPVLHSIRATCS